MKNIFVLAALISATCGCSATYRITPVDNPPATVRYDRGAPTTSLQQRNGAVQVTPIQYDSDGKMVFAVAAYNSVNRLANFGVENVEARSGDRGLRIFTVDDLIREARNEAIAASVGMALLGVAAAAASQAAARQTYHSSFHTPRGAYHYRATYYDGAQAAAGTAASIAGASAGIYAIHRSLDAAIEGIGQTVLQTTTVDAGETVAGRVIVQKPRGRKFPQEIVMVVRWNDEVYPFRFMVSRVDGRTPESSVASIPSTSTSSAPEGTFEPEASPASDEPPARMVAVDPPASAIPAIAPASLPARDARLEEPREADGVESDEEYNARMWREQAGHGR